MLEFAVSDGYVSKALVRVEGLKLTAVEEEVAAVVRTHNSAVSDLAGLVEGIFSVAVVGLVVVLVAVGEEVYRLYVDEGDVVCAGSADLVRSLACDGSVTLELGFCIMLIKAYVYPFYVVTAGCRKMPTLRSRRRWKKARNGAAFTLASAVSSPIFLGVPYTRLPNSSAMAA